MSKRAGIRLLKISLIVLFAGSLIAMIGIKVEQQRENTAFEKLRETVGQDVVILPQSTKETTKEIKKKQTRKQQPKGLLSLYEQNHDLFAWIKIPGTAVDYPVMYTPDEEQFYLHRSFDQRYSASGVPFLSKASSPAGNNLVIYGHHMRNGTMFADLVRYRSSSYRKNHRMIYLTTLQGQRSYRVVAAFATTVNKTEKFHYYQYGGKLNKEEWTAFVQGIRAKDEQAVEELPYGTRCITLSTCAYHAKNGRFVVVAALCEDAPLP